jgi:outer membrane protein TolC
MLSRSSVSAILPLVLIFIVFGSTPAIAQGEGASSTQVQAPGVRTITLDEAIAFARTHQPEIRAALSRIAARKAEADVPRAQWLPTFGVTAQLFGATANNTTGTYVSPGNFMDIPRIGGTRVVSSGSWQPYASTFVGAGLTQELFDFGRIAAQAAALDALTDVERQRANASTLDVTFNVEETYFAVLAAKAILKASEDAYARSRVHRDLAKAGVGAGLRSPIELTRAEADLARLDIGRIRARGGLLTAETALAAAVGVDEPALDAAGVPTTPPDLPALDAAIGQASTRDPRIAAAVAALRAEEEHTRAIGSELRPDLSLSTTISGRAGGATPSGNGDPANQDGWLPNVANWNIGVVFSWPIFDGTIRARQSASRAREEVRHEEIALVRHDQTVIIRQTYAAVDVARSALPGLGRSVEAARANYDQADARFKSGLGTSVELADAEALRTEADIQLALGQFDLARARAAFGRAIAEGL